MRPPEAAPALLYKAGEEIILDGEPMSAIPGVSQGGLVTDLDLNGYQIVGELETDELILDGGLME